MGDANVVAICADCATDGVVVVMVFVVVCWGAVVAWIDYVDSVSGLLLLIVAIVFVMHDCSAA